MQAFEQQERVICERVRAIFSDSNIEFNAVFRGQMDSNLECTLLVPLLDL